MSERTEGKTVEELVEMSRADGVEDSYSFAEWLVDGETYFGDFPLEVVDSQLELAWQQAKDWWDEVARRAR